MAEKAGVELPQEEEKKHEEVREMHVMRKAHDPKPSLGLTSYAHELLICTGGGVREALEGGALSQLLEAGRLEGEICQLQPRQARQAMESASH